MAPHQVSGSVLLSLPVSSPPPVSDRAVFSPLLCSVVQLTGLWSELPPELVSHWATTTSLTWIMDYADDVVLLAHKMDDINSALEVFETTESQLGLHVSWQKTKIQNLGAGESTPCLPVCGHSLEEVTEYTYLGSVQSTTGRCQPDVIRHIGIASTAMHSMNKVWRQTLLQLQTKLRLYQTCILSILLYGSETWTLLQEDLRKLEVFHMHSLRMIVGICWHVFVKNTEVVDRTNLPCVQDFIAKRRNSLFSHVVRLDDHTPAHHALSQVAAARTGPRFGPGWRRRPGRPRHSWIQQIGDGTPFSIRAEWSKARRCGHSGLTQWTSAVYAI